MYLGTTIEEKQRIYSETMGKARKVGKLLAMVGCVSMVIAWFIAVSLPMELPYAMAFKCAFFFGSFLCPVSGYIMGHAYYFCGRAIISALEGWIGDEVDGYVLMMMGTVLCIALFGIVVTVGFIKGLYDWRQLHNEAKKYGLKIQKG